jgi:hypothetical protein
MASPIDTFELLAELSLALGGFSGVAASFGGRDRTYRPIEIARLTGVFSYAGMSLVGALLAISLTHAGIAASDTYAAAALTCCLMVLWYLATQVPPVFRLYRAGESTTSGPYMVFSFSYMFALVFLFLWSALYEREAWPLIVGISTQLVYGLWIFARLLLRAN